MSAVSCSLSTKGSYLPDAGQILDDENSPFIGRSLVKLVLGHQEKSCLDQVRTLIGFGLPGAPGEEGRAR
jgi:hypothetical protein